MARPHEDNERLGPPKKGEWRSLFHEREQTFKDYAASEVRQFDGIRLQPLGDLSGRAREMIVLMSRYAAAYFGLETSILAPLPMFPKARISTRDQVNSSMVLDELSERAPADSQVSLGVTDLDLFARGKKYVFGESSGERRTGICSLARLAAPDASLFERRALKLMTHEAGHLLSIAHCTTHRCVMQGSNTLEESDGHPLHLCAKDLRKLAWSTGVDLGKRALDLKAFYEARGWREEAHRMAQAT